MVSIIGANYSALKKRKSKADPGQVKAKEERRRRRLAKVCKILTSVLTDHLEKRIIFIRGNSIRFDLWEKIYFSYFFNESFYSCFRPSEKWKRRIGWQNHWWSVRFPSLCTRRGQKDWGRNIIGLLSRPFIGPLSYALIDWYLIFSILFYRGIEVSKEQKEARILHMKDWARHTYVRLVFSKGDGCHILNK